MGTLISEETIYNTEAATKTIRYTYQSLEDFGTEVENMANQTYKVSGGVYEYSGENVFFWNNAGGGPGGGGGTGETELSVSGAATVEPIENHPYFDSIGGGNDAWDAWNRWKANPQDPKNYNLVIPGYTVLNDDLGYFDPSKYPSDNALGVLYQLYMRGTKEYYEAKVVVRLTRFENAAPPLTLIGKINAPPIDPGGMTNYILNNAEGRYTPSTQLWQNTYEWVGSRKGWPTAIYGPTA
jgi:hypothetical protein